MTASKIDRAVAQAGRSEFARPRFVPRHTVSTTKMKVTGWHHFSHEADIGIEGSGPDLASAFAQCALGLTAVICDPAQVQARLAVEIDCEAPDRELLLVDWLNALIYHMASEHLLFARFELELNGVQLHARAWGEPVDVPRHQPAVEVKGATYTGLRVYQDAAGWWHARCIVDV